MKLTDYLGDKPFWRVTVKLAVPVALQNVLTSSFQLVDTLMVSQLGDVTLSAVGMAAQWGWLCGLLGFGGMRSGSFCCFWKSVKLSFVCDMERKCA